MDYNAKQTVTLMAVGDIMLGDSLLCTGHGVGAKVREKGVKFPFLHVAYILHEGDIVIGNLEAVLSESGLDRRRFKSVAMRAMPESVEGLSYAGFNILSLANNHILEHGYVCLLETAKILSQNRINYIGVDAYKAKARQPLIVTAKGVKIAFLGYCLVPDKTAYISVNDHEEIVLDVIRTKSQADILVVSLHWGSEYIEQPAPWQINLAHKIIDSGANIILGHHPHVIQGVEEYNKGLIAYSLGNFVFDMIYLKETRSSFILECRLSKGGIVNYLLHPTYTGLRYAPDLLRGEKKETMLTKLHMLSSEIKEMSVDEGERKATEYKKQVEVLRKNNSRIMIKYFLSNIYRYHPGLTLQVIADYLHKQFR